jgi:hypothetical protein
MNNLVAIALRKSVHVSTIEKLLAIDGASSVAASAHRCSRCGARFAILSRMNDPLNLDHLKTMNELISADCREGEHGLEIELTSAIRANVPAESLPSAV